MLDEAHAMASLNCDFCGKRDREVRRLFAMTGWNRQERTICDECVFICNAVMLHEDLEWFEKKVDETKRAKPHITFE
jgi:ATP-dependent protease Clp ATPase subunit